MKLSTLKLNDRNPRTISKDAFQKLCNSIKRDPTFMELRPIVVDKNNIVIGGNMRLRGCLELGMTEVPDAWVVKADKLTPEQRKRFIVVDNAPNGMAGEWDTDILSADFEIPELEELGFDVGDLLDDKGESQDAEPQVDNAAELNKKWKVKTGDLFQIGCHKLLCGDSTKRKDVELLMGGEKADMVFTDPPYGVAYSGLGQSTGIQSIENDDLNPDELCEFLTKAFSVMPCSNGCNIFVCHADGRRGIQPAFESAFERAGYVQGCKIIWVKNVASMGWQDFRSKHEPILFGWKKGKDRIRVKDRSLTTVWDVGREGNYMHPTTKPVELIGIALKACSKDGTIVWDSFLGSGTTMVACQNLNRKCRGIEISPDYCAVILERMHTAFPDLEINKL